MRTCLNYIYAAFWSRTRQLRGWEKQFIASGTLCMHSNRLNGAYQNGEPTYVGSQTADQLQAVTVIYITLFLSIYNK